MKCWICGKPIKDWFKSYRLCGQVCYDEAVRRNEQMIQDVEEA